MEKLSLRQQLIQGLFPIGLAVLVFLSTLLVAEFVPMSVPASISLATGFFIAASILIARPYMYVHGSEDVAACGTIHVVACFGILFLCRSGEKNDVLVGVVLWLLSIVLSIWIGIKIFRRTQNITFTLNAFPVFGGLVSSLLLLSCIKPKSA